MNLISLDHQAHCIVGSDEESIQLINQQLHQLFCKKNDCSDCSLKVLLHNKLHPQVIVLDHNENYNAEFIDDLLQQTKYKLDTNEYRFFIFPYAQKLSISCFNRLLKTIEEPLARYYFIFLTDTIDAILPTIQSRCHTTYLRVEPNNDRFEDLLKIMLSPDNNPIAYNNKAEKIEWDEYLAKKFLDYAISKVHQNIIKAYTAQNKDLMVVHAQQLAILHQHLTMLPAQGAAKLFLKNLYITLHQIHHATMAH